MEEIKKCISILASSKAFKIPHATLYSRLKGVYFINMRSGPSSVLISQEEEELRSGSDILAGEFREGYSPTTPLACLGALFLYVPTLSLGLRLVVAWRVRINNNHTASFRRTRAAFSLPHHTLRGPSNFNCQSTVVRWWWLISPRALLEKPDSPTNISEPDLSFLTHSIDGSE